jgi:hypothetical protein
VLLPYQQGSACMDTVNVLLANRDAFLDEVRACLLQAQEYARKHYDVHHCTLEFTFGD